MLLISCEINLVLAWSARCFIIYNPIDDQKPTFTITDAKLYDPVVTLSTQDTEKILQELKSGFKRTINWSKFDPKVTIEQQKQYLGILINPPFQGVNRLFTLSFENNGGRRSNFRFFTKNFKIIVNLSYFNIMSV